MAARAVVRSLLGALSGWGARRRLLIFSYHRVLAEPDFLLTGEPTVEQFTAHARFMAAYLNVLPLPEAAERLRAGTLPPRAACITFDDGYRNNYELAAPILEAHGLTATFFIATGAVEDGAMWNDRIIEAVRHAPSQWDLTAFGLGQWDCSTPAARAAALQALIEPVKYHEHDARNVLAEQVYASVRPHQPLRLMMTPAMVRELAARGFDIGGHTVTHPILAMLDDDRSRAEIAACRAWLEQTTGRAPVSFAYPNGRPGIDFQPRHAELLRELGFTCAVSTEWAVATAGHDPFALPRFTPWEYNERGWLARIAKSYVRSRTGK
jgi:peptidoglycan/xylan/chitin deacetylase (PgdA/CDA1 family)